MPAQGGLVTRSIDHSPDVVVVGAGIAGLSVAQRAAARGLRPLVLDGGDLAGGATHVAAGMLAPIDRGGGEVRAGVRVRELLVESDRVAGVRLQDESELRAGAVVVAAGARSGQLGGLPEHARVPVRPVKGQLLRLRDPAGPGLLDRVLRTEECYVVPRGDGRYVLGATVEERGFDETVTAGALHDLLRDGVEVLPGLAELEVLEASAGLRPGTPDNAPAL